PAPQRRALERQRLLVEGAGRRYLRRGGRLGRVAAVRDGHAERAAGAAAGRPVRRAAVLAALAAAALVLPAPPAAGAVVRVDQVGYATGDAKRALVYSQVAETGASFAVVTPTGTPVLVGSLAAPIPPGWSSTYPFVYALDLSRLTAPNRYRVVVRGRATATCLPFSVADRAVRHA